MKKSFRTTSESDKCQVRLLTRSTDRQEAKRALLICEVDRREAAMRDVNRKFFGEEEWMCLRRKQMPMGLRLNYLALSLLMASRSVMDRGIWRTSFVVSGAVVLVVAIAFMFADRSRGGNQGAR